VQQPVRIAEADSKLAGSFCQRAINDLGTLFPDVGHTPGRERWVIKDSADGFGNAGFRTEVSQISGGEQAVGSQYRRRRCRMLVERREISDLLRAAYRRPFPHLAGHVIPLIPTVKLFANQNPSLSNEIRPGSLTRMFWSLYVAVNVALRMGVRERVEHLGDDRDRLLRGKATAARLPRAWRRRAVDKTQLPDKTTPLLVPDRGNSNMFGCLRAHQLDLAHKATQSFR